LTIFFLSTPTPVLSLHYLISLSVSIISRSSQTFLLHGRPPSRSGGLRPDYSPPHHGMRHGVPGSLAVNQCYADLASPNSPRSHDGQGLFRLLLKLSRTMNATSSHRFSTNTSTTRRICL
uniref:Uncharacterized protein n=1 Tax=Triticum urartu TaxID=4572 RepID=A0A8R7TJE3_TRIUA